MNTSSVKLGKGVGARNAMILVRPSTCSASGVTRRTSVIVRLVITGQARRQTLASVDNITEFAAGAFKSIVAGTALRLAGNAQSFNCVYTNEICQLI